MTAIRVRSLKRGRTQREEATRRKRLMENLAYIRMKLKDPAHEGDSHLDLIPRDALEHLIAAHDEIPKVLHSLGDDFQKLIAACHEAADALEKGGKI